jgi:alpha-tubulin suppressor-like RCC1 family protein
MMRLCMMRLCMMTRLCVVRLCVIRMMLAPLAITGCEFIAGLDEDRPLASLDDSSCVSGAKRCRLGAVEICADGRWTAAESCALGCAGGECATDLVAAGHQHTCVRLDGGKVACWGRNDFLQTGAEGAEICRDGIPCRREPAFVSGLSGVTVIATLGHHSCAIADGEIYCWGHNGFGQIGNAAPRIDEGEPLARAKVPLADERPVIARAGGGLYAGRMVGHSCAVTDGGRVYCWGANCAGQLGLGVGLAGGCPTFAPACDEGDVPTNFPAPLPITLPFRVIDIVLGAAHTCALTDVGEVHCWGWNSFGQVDPTSPDEPCVITPRQVVGLDHVATIAAGSRVTCATRETGEAICWGASDNGLLGTSTFDHGPIEVPAVAPVVEVAGGHGTHACARRLDGTMACWGENANGELGVFENLADAPADGAVKPATSEPVVVPSLPPVVSVSLGGNHTCAWATDGELYCWGQSSVGALGLTGDDRPIPPRAIDVTPP